MALMNIPPVQACLSHPAWSRAVPGLEGYRGALHFFTNIPVFYIQALHRTFKTIKANTPYNGEAGLRAVIHTVIPSGMNR